MKRLAYFMVVLSFVSAISFLPQKSAAACSGTSCRGLDPAIERDSYGRLCSVTAHTVYGGYSRTGTNGRVKNELRYSTGCVSNWSRASVLANNANTKWLYAKVWEKPSPGWNYYYHIYGNPLGVGSYCYTNMVSGTVTTISFVGISSVSWYGPYNPDHQYEG
jgi:hypothetical protein